MDFSAPYRVITPTLEGPVLRALADVSTSLTRAQIAGIVDDVSEAGIRKALHRLVEQGIVIEERIGSRYTYRANRDHLLWPSVEGLFTARELLRQRVAELVATWDLAPVSVDLFGSVARGRSSAASDVDIVVIRPPLEEPGDAEEWSRQVDGLHDKVVLWTGNACDVVVMDAEEIPAAKETGDTVLNSTTSPLAGAGLTTAVTGLTGVHQKACADAARKLATSSLNDARLRASFAKINEAILAQSTLPELTKAFDAAARASGRDFNTAALKAIAASTPPPTAVATAIEAARQVKRSGLLDGPRI